MYKERQEDKRYWKLVRSFKLQGIEIENWRRRKRHVIGREELKRRLLGGKHGTLKENAEKEKSAETETGTAVHTRVTR